LCRTLATNASTNAATDASIPLSRGADEPVVATQGTGKPRPTFLLDLIALVAFRRALHRNMRTLPARALEFQSKQGTTNA
jgi:hypothetical protein